MITDGLNVNVATPNMEGYLRLCSLFFIKMFLNICFLSNLFFFLLIKLFSPFLSDLVFATSHS